MFLLPTIDENGNFTDGSMIKAHLNCATCFKVGRCKNFYDSLKRKNVEGFYMCPNGMTTYLFQNKTGNVLFFTCFRNEKYYDKNKEKKLLTKGVFVNNPLHSDLESRTLIKTAREIIDIETREKQKIDDFNSMTHEIKSLNGKNKELGDLLLQNTFQNISGGLNEEECYELKERIRTIYFSSCLIAQKFSLKKIEETTFNKAEAIPVVVYKKFDKMSKFYSNSKQHVRIQGNSMKTIDADSYFENIPLLLIDNAVKYSYNHERVDVYFKELDSALKVKIESYGPYCDSSEFDRIVEKGYRGKNAVLTEYNGSGLGLFYVKELCNRYGIKISFNSEKPTLVNGVQYGRFIVTLLFE